MAGGNGRGDRGREDSGRGIGRGIVAGGSGRGY